MRAIETLLSEVSAFYQSSGARSNETRLMLDKVVRRLERVQPLPPPEPLGVPGLKHWDRILETWQLKNNNRLLTSIATAEPFFRWIQNPNYSDELMGSGYMDNYGFIELAGKSAAHYSADNIRCGLFLLGSCRHYPPHNHPAEEIYHILSGEGTFWRRGDEDWRTYTAGAPIHHAPWMVHETRTAEEPLLALYCWMGDGANAKLV